MVSARLHGKSPPWIVHRLRSLQPKARRSARIDGTSQSVRFGPASVSRIVRTAASVEELAYSASRLARFSAPGTPILVGDLHAMTAIERILTTGESAREEVLVPTDEEIREVESEVGFRFPPSYCEFLRLGGLGELRIHHRVLTPSEILEALQYLQNRDIVPFADNGCGDLYCWPRSESLEPIVVFADHQEDYKYFREADSFTAWLEDARF
jgi:hypothetical protein